MLQFVQKFWKDSVFSKVIATGIILALGFIFTKLSNIDFLFIGNYILSKLSISFSIQLWIILLNFIIIFSLLFFVCFNHFQSKGIDLSNNYLELTEDDIFAKIVAWWPRAEGILPENVAIDFRKLEIELSLPQGSVIKYIDKAARLDNYKIKVRGQNNAVYEYDMDAVNFGRSF